MRPEPAIAALAFDPVEGDLTPGHDITPSARGTLSLPTTPDTQRGDPVHDDLTPTTRLTGDQLATPLAAVLLALLVLAHLVLFDQGQVGLLLTGAFADAGGVLHETFHDARHLFGVPCH